MYEGIDIGKIDLFASLEVVVSHIICETNAVVNVWYIVVHVDAYYV